jgi:hypothetical protein
MKIKRNKVFSIFKCFFVFLVIFLLGKSLCENWEELKKYSFEPNAWVLVISVLLMLLSIFVLGVLWNFMLGKLSNKKMGICIASYVHFSSWLSRYIPGKVGVVLTKIILGKKMVIKLKN